MPANVLDRFSLEGRTAILTGVGPGVGAHVACAFAELGANVVLSARSSERIDRLAAYINSLGGGRAVATVANAGKREDLARLTTTAREAFGPIHILFNSAASGGIYPPTESIWDNTEEEWSTCLDVNLMATWRLAELTSAEMKLHGQGKIISVLSCAGFTPLPPSIAYGVSKAALAFLIRSLAKALAPHTRVNGLCIGSMSPDGIEPEARKPMKLAERNAIKRFGAAQEAVGAAILLASDASSYTTGSVVFAEGGRIGTVS